MYLVLQLTESDTSFLNGTRNSLSNLSGPPQILREMYHWQITVNTELSWRQQKEKEKKREKKEKNSKSGRNEKGSL